MYAHYTQGSKVRPATVTIARDVAGRDAVATVAVIGKREARAIAIRHNAQPWNF